MNVLVLGGGGREHAIIKALRKNPTINRIYCTPGNDGMDGGTPFPIAADNFSTLIRFAKTEHVEYIVVSPDNPLVEGAVDRFTEAGFRCFGPTKAAAQLLRCAAAFCLLFISARSHRSQHPRSGWSRKQGYRR